MIPYPISQSWLQTAKPARPGVLPDLTTLCTHPHKFGKSGRFGLYQEHGHGSLEDIPIPGRHVNWSPPPQASLDYERTSSLIPLGSSTAPLPPFASSQSQLFLFYSTSHSFTVFFNFAFLCSIYLGAGSHLHQARLRRSPNEFVSILLHSQLITLISAATDHTDLVIHTHILSARHRCPISFHGEHHRNSTHSLPPRRAVASITL